MRATLNPTFSIETGELLSHDGIFEVEEFPIRCDRSAQKQAKTNVSGDNAIANETGSTATGINAQLIPGLETESKGHSGYSPTDQNNMLVAGGEAVGGSNAGITGQANLTAARTRNAGGFAASLDEAARDKSRQLSNNALGVANQNAQLEQQNQRFAQGQLANISNEQRQAQLKAMGLSDEAIQQELAAGRQGWLQNTEGVLDTLSGGAKAAFGKPGGAGYAT
jgi:hypothetical protein